MSDSFHGRNTVLLQTHFILEKTLRFPPRRKSVYLAAIFERPQGWQPVEKVYAPSNFVKRQLKTVIDCV